MRNIPIELEITNDQLASMEPTDIESFLYETIRENISTQLLTQLEDDGFIDISPTDASYKVTCNLVLGSQKEFYSAITDVAKELMERHYNENFVNNILSPLYKLMGEEQKVNDAEEGKQDILEEESTYHVGYADPVRYGMTRESIDAFVDAANYDFARYVPNLEQVQIHTTPITAEDIRDAARRTTSSLMQSEIEEFNVWMNEHLGIQGRRQNTETEERIKNLIKERENGNLLMLIDIANRQGYIEFNNIQAGCSNIMFRQLIKEALPAFYEQHKSVIEGTTND